MYMDILRTLAAVRVGAHQRPVPGEISLHHGDAQPLCLHHGQPFLHIVRVEGQDILVGIHPAAVL